ncbi:MAG: HipA domain-containing protein [Erysipelotrichaceae bacterium]|nr:HipA domain-containing protein [Erysipelotrichaceae bacterium]
MFFGRILNKDAATIDLSSPDNTSDGILKKKWKIIGGKRCLIKGSRKPFNQEVANEILAARICKRLGIPFVDYWVIDIDGEKYSVCEDFITSNTELVAAWRITKLIKTDSNTSAYEAFVKKVEELGIVDARKRIDMMLTLDFIIVNTDRHYNNFGLIRDANTMKWLSVAPFFDSGSSMWHADLHSNINPTASHYESKPFNKKLEDQIKHVKDFSWLNFDALDGIEDEFREILEQAIPATAKIPARNKALCIALRKRIKLLQDIVKENELADDYQTRR